MGQFKSGKSSLLNTLLGEAIFPVGAVPVTAVITRVSAGPERTVCVTHLDGSKTPVAWERLADFVTERCNPGNRHAVAVVDVETPSMRNWQGMRLVDTPGLGSVWLHNTKATASWLPNVAVALIVVSVERPLADEDLRLVKEAQNTAARVVMLLNKVDLVSASELAEVSAFIGQTLQTAGVAPLLILPFSSRADPSAWVRQLRQRVIDPIASELAEVRTETLRIKLTYLKEACRGYLQLGLDAARRTQADRDRVRSAVLDESVHANVIGEELRSAEMQVAASSRSAFERLLLAPNSEIRDRLSAELAAAVPDWHGNLAIQTKRFESWLHTRLLEELEPFSESAGELARELANKAEMRLTRVVEAFRDRIGRNIQRAAGIEVSPARWQAIPPTPPSIPIAVGRTFMTHWEMLWWMLPMPLVGGLFRRHILGLVAGEVEKNLRRLASDWTAASNAAMAQIRGQAESWVAAEIATLERLLARSAGDESGYADAIAKLDRLWPPG